MSYNITHTVIEIASERIHRAREHIENFKREADSFLAINPYKAVRGDIHVEGNEYIASFYFRVVWEPPTSLRLIAGDAIHNLCSTLDNLGWALARSRSFPIYSTEAEFDKKCIKFIDCPTGVQDLIRALQPYNAGNKAAEHPLRVLRDLWNGDKHEVPILLGSRIGGFMIAKWKPGSARHIRDRSGRGLQDGAEIVAFASKDPQVIENLHPDFMFDVTFDDGRQGAPARWTLKNMHDFVLWEVLTKLIPFAK